ncbi:MAG: N-acetylmuramoyl-L-alanine amidase [Clostridia bacterium]
MKKKNFKLFPVFLCLLILFAFCAPVSATESSYYAEEEEGSYNSGFTVMPSEGISPLASNNGNLIVVLDPGHGGRDGGASANGARESELNMKVALYCKQYLENYSNVTVYLTRPDNNTLYSLEERAAIAASYGADMVMSIHFNSGNATGAEVYVSRLEEYALTDFAQNVVKNLNSLGITNRGVKTRASENGTYWTDHIRLADYYGIISNPAYYEIPSTIVEHCFINTSDYFNFANTDTKLQALGEADAKAIVSYFQLDETISETTLANKKYAALEELNRQYDSMDITRYNGVLWKKITAIYKDAKSRIENATGTGKIDLTLNRAVKTLKNYPMVGENETQFRDVMKTDWFWPAVKYCTEQKMFFGTSDDTFSPQQSITRGMFITVLGRMAGVEEKTPCETKFSDVSPNQYYASHIKWATDKNIVAGTAQTLYSPDIPIRREDLMRMLHNYCMTENITIPETSTKTISDFRDGGSVDSWAVDAMNWGIQHGILQGDNTGKLNPRDNATRAEVAQIMMAFSQNTRSNGSQE